ncbi:MAG: YhgE/Pip domain-containing protein [Eggerthellaceae bacterium]|nr:YhgE/Pip domain-containing protein [Eggerthellaceae bacterium]
MHNAFAIFKEELRRMFSNVVSVVIAIGLIAMPSIFAWYNIIACWNVFDNTGNLTVAVANTDEGYQSDLVPIRVNIGDQVVGELRANSQIDWVFTTEDDALDGARSGRYYAAVVIPKEFSRDMLTFYSDTSNNADIIYYSNQKANAIAPKITDRGADTVSYEVNQVFATTLSEVALSLAESFSNYLDESDAQGAIMQLADHMGSAAASVRDVSEILRMYGSLADDSAVIIQAAKQASSEAGAQVDALKGAASGTAGSVPDLVASMKNTVQALREALSAGSGDFAQVGDAADEAFDQASQSATQAAAQMRQTASTLSSRASAYGSLADRLDALAPAAGPQYEQAVRQAAELLRTQSSALSAAASSMQSAADKLESGMGNVDQERQEVKDLLAQASDSMDQASASFDDMAAGLDQLADQASTLASNVRSSVGSLAGVASGISGGADAAVDALEGASAKISETSADLDAAADGISDVADRLRQAVAAGDSDAVQNILSSDVSVFAKALAAPVAISRVPVYPAENFGSQMAPLYSTLALFIGSLLILVVMKPAPSRVVMRVAPHAKPRQVFFGHFGIMAFISLCQTTLTSMGNMLFLQVQVAEPWLYLLAFWVAGFVFTLIIYSLVVSFANLGKAIAVLMLIIQVTGCGGSFPLQILPGFVQALSPYLPATYAVGAMREAMMGTYGMVFWQQIVGLLAFCIPALLLGLALRKPLEKLMKWYLAQVDKSELMA